MQKRKQARAGFTLVELLVVITILAIIGTFAAQQVMSEPDKAKVKVTKASFTSLENALERFKLDVGRYPTAEEGLAALYDAPEGVENWAGKYLTKRRSLKDAWENDYVYVIPGPDNEPFEIRSYGADKVEGGEKFNTDLSSLDEK